MKCRTACWESSVSCKTSFIINLIHSIIVEWLLSTRKHLRSTENTIPVDTPAKISWSNLLRLCYIFLDLDSADKILSRVFHKTRAVFNVSSTMEAPYILPGLAGHSKNCGTCYTIKSRSGFWSAYVYRERHLW